MGILAFVEVRKGKIHGIGVNRNQGREIRGRGEREREVIAVRGNR